MDKTSRKQTFISKLHFPNLVHKELEPIVARLDGLESGSTSTYIMPSPDSTTSNTQILQQLLDLASVDKPITIRFPEGTYHLNTCYFKGKTTLELNPNTVIIHVPNTIPDLAGGEQTLKSLFFNAIPYDDNYSQITGYNGVGGIHIKGGTINTNSLFTFIHSKDIVIEDVNLVDINGGVSNVLASCKNVKVKNCNFSLIYHEQTNGLFHLAHLDKTDSNLFYWDVKAPIYDNGVCSDITIEGCVFAPSSTNNNTHTGRIVTSVSNKMDENIRHHHIHFKGNDIRMTNRHIMIVVGINFLHVYDNQVYTKNGYGDLAYVSWCNNVYVRRNSILGSSSLCQPTNCRYVFIEDNDVIKTKAFSGIYVTTCYFITIKNNRYNGCTFDNYGINVRASSYVTITNNIEVGCTFNGGDYFMRIYSYNSVGVDRIIILGNVSDKDIVTYTSTTTNLICDFKEEVIWEGTVNTVGEDIKLTSPLSCFTDIRIDIEYYGVSQHLILFNSSNRLFIRQFNVSDNGTTTDLNVCEVALDLINDSLFRINRIGEVTRKDTGSTVSNANPTSTKFFVKKIYGKRIKFN